MPTVIRCATCWHEVSRVRQPVRGPVLAAEFACPSCGSTSPFVHSQPGLLLQLLVAPITAGALLLIFSRLAVLVGVPLSRLVDTLGWCGALLVLTLATIAVAVYARWVTQVKRPDPRTYTGYTR